MHDTASHQPKHFLLQIVVTTDLTVTVLSYYDGQNASQNLHVNVGDRVAFLVQLAFLSGRKPIPYEVTFTNSSFFGLTSLNVPAGGVSSFLTVRSILGKTSYSVKSPGFDCILDPEIQSGTDGPRTKLLTVSTFYVTWNTALNENKMTYRTDSDPNPKDFPMTVSLHDKINFAVSGSDISSFNLNFSTSQNQNSWATPFGPELYIVKDAGHGSQVVKDYIDGNNGSPAAFSFFGSALVSGVRMSSPENTINLL